MYINSWASLTEELLMTFILGEFRLYSRPVPPRTWPLPHRLSDLTMCSIPEGLLQLPGLLALPPTCLALPSQLMPFSFCALKTFFLLDRVTPAGLELEVLLP
jgi:hypothetical protein